MSQHHASPTTTRPSTTATASSGSQGNALSAEQVASYLRQHPDFFQQFPTVLSDMSLPHAAGDATSLIERQVAILRERNVQTRHRLGELLEAARANDELLNKTQTLIVKLLDCATLGDMLNTLQRSLETDFDVQKASVLLVTEHAMPTLGDNYRALSEARQHIAGLIEKPQSLCGSIRPAESEYLFGSSAEPLGSIGMTNVQIDAAPAYLLIAVGHRDADHYRSDTGTLFLDYLSAVLKRLASQHYVQALQ